MIILAESTNTDKKIWEFRNESLREKVVVDHVSAGPIYYFKTYAKEPVWNPGPKDHPTWDSIGEISYEYWALQVGANCHIALGSEEEAKKAFNKICAGIQRGAYMVKIGKDEKKDEQEDI